MGKGKLLLWVAVFFGYNASGQNLLRERIRAIQGRKTGVYLNKGIFHHSTVKGSSALTKVRQSFDREKKRERLVFDFSSEIPPKLYGSILGDQKKIFIDFFYTELKSDVGTFSKGYFVRSVDFYPWSDGSVSVELEFKERVTVDIFYLNSPGRFVLDIKGFKKI